MEAEKLKLFRENLFLGGLAVPDIDDVKHWTIVSPFNIRSVDIWLQDKFFKQ